MKKFLLIILVAFFATNVAFSQKVTSKSHSIQITKTKKPAKPHYFSIKAGGGVLGTEDNGVYGMYDIEVGFTKYFKHQTEGFFWGVQLGSDMCVMRDFYSGNYAGEWQPYYEENCPTLYLGPSFGYSTSLTNNVSFSLNLSANGVYVFCGGNDFNENLGCLIKLQPGVWFNRFYVGIEGFFQTCTTPQGGVAAQIGYRF